MCIISHQCGYWGQCKVGVSGIVYRQINLLKPAYSKISTQQYHVTFSCNTRGNNYKLQNHSFYYDLQKHFFPARIVNIGNSLPNQLLMLALLMHLEHAQISFGSTNQLNLTLPSDVQAVYCLHRGWVSLKDDGPTGQTTGQRGSNPSAYRVSITGYYKILQGTKPEMIQ